MTKTITAFDLEATGLDVTKEHILQLGLVKFDSETGQEIDNRSWYIIPEVDEWEIQPSAADKTGLDRNFIFDNGIYLSKIWKEAVEFIGEDDMLSYNGLHYDIPLLYNNLKRYGLKFNFKDRKFYDSLVIELKRTPMKLEDVYKRYTGTEMDGAHEALNDIRALITVFNHQKAVTTEDIESNDFVVKSPEGFVKYNDEGELVFATGKYKGETTNSVCMKDPSYIRWIADKFSDLTKETIKEEWIRFRNSQNQL